MRSLDEALESLAAAAFLLVVTDFDGTLAPIMEHPADAWPLPRSRRALATLARQPHTRVAVVSGRALADLEGRLRPAEDALILIGSHGGEYEPELTGRLDPAQRELRESIRAAVDSAASGVPGILVEHKDASSSLHYRQASRPDAAIALGRLRRAFSNSPATRPWVKRGKKVVELAAIETDKGGAVIRLKNDVGATRMLFLGDDRTDEDAFRALSVEDVGVKVGPGASSARFRVDDPGEVADLLAHLAELRIRALRQLASIPIADLGLLADGRTGALVAPSGAICWLCPRRFDSPALFASLLGGPVAGDFVVAPAGHARGHLRYRPDSLVLETKWPGLTVTDFLDPYGGEGTVLVREAEPSAEGCEVDIRFAPRVEYGRVPTRLLIDHNRVLVAGTTESILLTGPPDVRWRLDRIGASDVATARLNIHQRERWTLTVGPAAQRASRADDVVDLWRSWTDSLELPDRWPDYAKRSALVLRALTYAPTGAPVAALTTSLPEAPGYERNWDYRYCWLRDASMAADALLRLGDVAAANNYVRWLEKLILADQSKELQPLYGVAGESHLPESDLAHLIGYAGSQPVRIGNAAGQQLQMDVYGSIIDLLDAVDETAQSGAEARWEMVVKLMRTVGRRWNEPDAGIWEQRYLLRHHVHSRTMGWVAVDRAVRIARRHGRSVPDLWLSLRSQIAAEVQDLGYSSTRGAFTAAYGSEDLDAAVLAIALYGLLPPDDHRVQSTVAVLMEVLLDRQTLRRYVYRDGLSGAEGGFHLCTSWLIDSLVLLDRRKEAEDLFTHLLGTAGTAGLLSEQVDPATGRALGNVPQGYSHIGVISNILSLSGSPRSRISELRSDPLVPGSR